MNKTGTLFRQLVKTTITHEKKNSIPAEISSQFPAHMPLKGTPGKDASWPENAETMPTLPPAGFVWLFISIPAAEVPLSRTQQYRLALQMKSRKGLLNDITDTEPHMPTLFMTSVCWMWKGSAHGCVFSPFKHQAKEKNPKTKQTRSGIDEKLPWANLLFLSYQKGPWCSIPGIPFKGMDGRVHPPLRNAQSTVQVPSRLWTAAPPHQEPNGTAISGVSHQDHHPITPVTTVLFNAGRNGVSAGDQERMSAGFLMRNAVQVSGRWEFCTRMSDHK